MTTPLQEIKQCQVCGNGNLDSVMNLGNLPIPDDLVPIYGSESVRICDTYPTEILFCDTCKTAQQRWELPTKKVFHPDYHYRAANTKDVLSGMAQLVDTIEKRHGSLKNIKVLDIGCNDGCLLDVFKARGAITTGIEPTNAADDAAGKGHGIDKAFLDVIEAQRYVKTYGPPDIITFTNVFAHIPNLTGLLACLDIIRGPTTRIVIENHYLGAVLDRKQFDTFYHEHLRTYSYTSFLHIAQSLNCGIEWVEFPARYGGNIRVCLTPLLMNKGHAESHEARIGHRAPEANFKFRLGVLDRQVKEWQKNKQAQLLLEIDHQSMAWTPIPAAAFPGRAAVLFVLLGLTERDISAVYEVPISKKIGHYVPGTRIPILSDDDFPWHTYDGPVLNTAWHIADEIDGRWRSKGFKGKMIQAIEPSDFN
ncbi:MAG TPA: methyltransferase domain-containing protein [Candidatus Saccharimonadia bacterium]|nr:methyltransferase domain-containing protein [Candidatus Saccharimonadia bacterium]